MSSEPSSGPLSELQLLGTDGCTLCTEALALVAPISGAFGYELVVVDIALDDALFERFGTQIPVLRRVASDAVLCWPFDRDAVLAFIAG